MQGVTRRHQTPTLAGPSGMPGTDMPRLTGMQEVSGSSPLSSTGQKRNSKSRQRVQQESSATAAGWAVVRVFGSGIFLRAGCWQDTGFQALNWRCQPATWANPRLGGYCQ